LLTTAGDHVPVMPLSDVVGNTGPAVPEQIGAIAAKVGVTAGVIVTSSVVDVAHWPASGVNVYVPLTVLLTTAGDQVPVMPLSDVVGSTGAAVPEQIGAIAAKVGVKLGVTVTSTVVCVAHWPASGVNVYVPLTVLLTTAGDQVPVIPLIDVVGNTGDALPEQIGAMAAKVGVTAGVIVTSIVVDVAHWPASGVNVYIPLTVLLTTAGDQVPVMPLSDVVGNTGAVVPEQIGAITAKLGVTFGITVMSSVVAALAHCPAVGVNVYVVVPVAAVLITAGVQVPLMPLLDVAGNTGAAEFIQSEPIAVNTGIICASIVTSNVVTVAH